MADEFFRNEDRRAAVRVPARIEVRFGSSLDAAKAFRTFSINFSAGGLCVRSNKSHEVGSKLMLALGVEGESFELEGTVCWVRDGCIGVRFDNVSAEDRVRLEAMAKLLLEQKKASMAPWV